MEKTNNITTINIQNEANVNAEGKHVHGRSISVVEIETGRVFVSIIDAAAHAGTNANYMAVRLRNDEAFTTIKGKRYCYLSRLMESSDMVLSQLREKSNDTEDARKWREYQAEQERIRKEEEDRIEAERKAKEKFELDKQKAIARIIRRKEIAARLATKFDEASARIIDAEKEYFDLTGEYYENSITT